MPVQYKTIMSACSVIVVVVVLVGPCCYDLLGNFSRAIIVTGAAVLGPDFETGRTFVRLFLLRDSASVRDQQVVKCNCISMVRCVS